jgi:hypothetical protein
MQLPQRALRRAAFTALMVSSVIASVARGATPTPASNADIKTLLQLSGTEKLANQMAVYMTNATLDMMKRNNPGMSDKVVAAAKDELQKIMAEKVPVLMEQIVPVYAKHFTSEEIKGLIAFYRTPLGAKMIHETPLIVAETSKVGEAWGRGLEPEIRQRLEARMKAEGLAPPPH